MKGSAKVMNKQELLQVTGGDGFSLGTLIGGAVTFIIGVLDGLITLK